MRLQTVVELGDAREGEEDPLWHTAGSRQPHAKRTARLDALPAPKALAFAPTSATKPPRPGAAGDRSRQQQPWSYAEETRRWQATSHLAIAAPTVLGAAVSLSPCSDPSSDTQAQQCAEPLHAAAAPGGAQHGCRKRAAARTSALLLREELMDPQ
jgi:hypothetical protein